MSDSIAPLSAESAERLRDAWRAVIDLMQGRPGPISHDQDHRARVAAALAVLAAKLLCDNVALENHADQHDPAVLAEAVAFAEREAARAEAEMLDAAFLLPPGPAAGPRDG